ncbi:hypothetical protein CAAN1_01S11848 [[Candida] anglica]|uniref:Alpha/beta hydrolase fold-3 domain-containing protein n=1 Tax=[Candida] anglica TaxID=148631 RepID=A0ABP0EME0_9ASCO
MTAIISLRGFFQLLYLPVLLLITTVKHYTVGTELRKYKNSLLSVLKITAIRTALSLDVGDTRIFGLVTNNFVLQKAIGSRYNDITRGLNGYGTKYDENSYWIVKQPNRDPSDPILYFLHGGAYFLQTSPQQLESIIGMYKLLDPEVQSKTSILLLDYKLVGNGHTFPTQINQLHQSYQNLTVRDKNTNIGLIGDSAGGNLSVIYTQYLKSLERSKVLKNPIYPRTMVLISPWINLQPELEQYGPGHSYYDNFKYDLIQYKYFMKPDSLAYLLGKEPLRSLLVSPNSKLPHSADDWSDIPTYADENSNIFVIAGEDESFRDDILKFAEFALECPFYSENSYGSTPMEINPKLHHYIRPNQPGKAGVELYVEPWGVHDALFFENHSLAKIMDLEKHEKVADCTFWSDAEFFATKRIVEFLNRVLAS